jgi:ABC-type nitrate/sulfonate/bicarbonate transport system ATPase subunit
VAFVAGSEVMRQTKIAEETRSMPMHLPGGMDQQLPLAHMLAKT